MKHLCTAGLLLATLSPLAAQAAILELTLQGSVDAVDAPLDTTFAVGDAFELKVQFDGEAGWDMWGSDPAGDSDGTWFNAHRVNGTYQNSFKIGNTYTASNSPVGPMFVDQLSGGKQRIDPGTNNYVGPDVAGLILREVYFDHDLQGSPIPGQSDNTDILNTSDLLGLTASFEPGQSNVVAFAPSKSSSDYKYVEFSLTSAVVAAVPEPPRRDIVYFDQAGIGDINGNGTPEFASLRTVRSGNVHVLIRDAISRDYIKTIYFLDSNYSPISLAAIPDGNGNGAHELAVMALDRRTGKTRTLIKDSLTGATLSRFNFSP